MTQWVALCLLSCSTTILVAAPTPAEPPRPIHADAAPAPQAWPAATTALGLAGARPPALAAAPAALEDLQGPIADALAWLATHQNANGSWGASLSLVQTGTSIESVAAIDPDSTEVDQAASWLSGQTPTNHDFLARQIVALAAVPEHVATAKTLAQSLLALRNPAEPDPLLPNWPEGGWGLAPGFETDSLTTALALRALNGTGFNGGFEVVGGFVPFGTRKIHPWQIPTDATKVRLLITVGGSGVRLCMTQGSAPPFCNPYFPLPTGTFQIVFPDSGLPFTPGTNFVVIEKVDAPNTPATYSLTASYETPTFDTRTLAEPVAYLRHAQNPDGGWGLKRGQPSDLYTSLHVLLALLDYVQYDLADEITDGVADVRAQQLGDGSFGLGGPGVPYMTALGALALMRSESCAFSSDSDDALDALVAQQAVDGSWGAVPYDTALAALALWERGDDLDADGVLGDGDCSGVVGDHPCSGGATIGCDDNCRSVFNPTQANADLDRLGDLCDCNSANGQVWAVPTDVTIGVRYFQQVPLTQISWNPTADSGGVGPAVYDTLQSTVASNFTTAAICLESDDSDTLASGVDLGAPLVFYLVRVQNACPGGGNLGQTSAGVPRVGRSCP